MESIIPTSTVRCFPNDKPLITSELKKQMNVKRKTFKEGVIDDCSETAENEDYREQEEKS